MPANGIEEEIMSDPHFSSWAEAKAYVEAEKARQRANLLVHARQVAEKLTLAFADQLPEGYKIVFDEGEVNDER
jgi:hypothetical protein